MATATTEGETASAAIIVIKKYANRRLYNTATSKYVTLEHLCQMVKDGSDFVVKDAKSDEDITRSVLTQIIFEEESKGQNMLPVSFLRQLIRFYGDSLQSLLPGYLDMSMQSFARNQENMRTVMANTFGEIFPFRQIEEMGRQNMAMFQQALNMFNPFVDGEGGEAPGNGAVPPGAPQRGQSELNRAELERLKSQLGEMQRRLDQITGSTDDKS